MRHSKQRACMSSWACMPTRMSTTQIHLGECCPLKLGCSKQLCGVRRVCLSDSGCLKCATYKLRQLVLAWYPCGLGPGAISSHRQTKQSVRITTSGTMQDALDESTLRAVKASSSCVEMSVSSAAQEKLSGHVQTRMLQIIQVRAISAVGRD